jgi:hypothetical protein
MLNSKILVMSKKVATSTTPCQQKVNSSQSCFEVKSV